MDTFIPKAAVSSLINRAMLARTESLCDLLLGSAKRINPDLEITEHKNTWINQWCITRQQEIE